MGISKQHTRCFVSADGGQQERVGYPYPAKPPHKPLKHSETIVQFDRKRTRIAFRRETLREMIMKKFAILSIASLMSLSAAQAEQPTSYFAVGQKMMTMENAGEEADVMGTQLTYGKRVHEKVILEGNLVTYYDIDTVDASSIDLSALIYPINNQLHIRVGVTDGEVNGEGQVGELASDTSEILGVGYSWLVGSSSGVRLEYTKSSIDDFDFDGFTLSVAARF
jgi:hypothetical protein